MKRLFILGSPRSGTTWVRELVGRHPATAASREPYVFTRYVARLVRAWETEVRYGAGLRFTLTEGEFFGLCRELAEKVAAKVAGGRRDVAVVIDKTPENAIAWRLIHRLFPDAYFLHVIRDPRDVVCSLRGASGGWGARWAPQTVSDAARLWRAFVAEALEIPAATDRYLEVRYEALAAAGAPELARILRWLDLPGDAPFCERASAECSVDAMKERVEFPPAFFRRCAAGGWQEELTGEQVRIVERICGDVMDRLGYARADQAGAAAGLARP